MILSRFAAPAAAAILLSLSLAGCSSTGQEPSLAPRAIERMEVGPPTASSTPPTPIPPAAPVPEKVRILVDQARTGHTAFQAALADTEAQVQRASTAQAGGETWIVAQQAITRLDALRSPVRDALAKLEVMQADIVYVEKDLAALLAVTSSVDAVAALEREETEALVLLGEKLAG